MLPGRLILICTEGQRPMAVLCLIKNVPAQLEFDEASQEAAKCATACALFICIRPAFSVEDCRIDNVKNR